MSSPKAQAKSAQLTRLVLKVSPGASRNAITGWMGDTLKLSVTVAPERGKANEAVIELLAERLGLPKSAVSVLRGAASRQKVVEIAGMTLEQVRQRLEYAP